MLFLLTIDPSAAFISQIIRFLVAYQLYTKWRCLKTRDSCSDAATNGCLVAEGGWMECFGGTPPGTPARHCETHSCQQPTDSRSWDRAIYESVRPSLHGEQLAMTDGFDAISRDGQVMKSAADSTGAA